MNPRVGEVYGAGHRTLDRDHEVLLSLIADLRKATDAAEISQQDIALQLRAYLESHFENEEQVMETVGYPGTDAHKAEHARLFEDTQAALGAVSLGDRDRIQRLIAAAELEIVQHMNGTDKELADYLHRMKVPAGPGDPFGVFGAG